MKTPYSLSVVLSVHNGAQQLSERVGMLLELLPEITTSFEVLILDNGSTDQSEEVAYELAHDFPQLGVARHAERQGEHDTIRTGLRQTSGELVIFYDERARIRPHELRRMWALRHDQELVIARRDGEQTSSLVDRLVSWAAQIKDNRVEQTTQDGIQMIRRRAIEQFEPATIEISETPTGSTRSTRRASLSTP